MCTASNQQSISPPYSSAWAIFSLPLGRQNIETSLIIVNTPNTPNKDAVKIEFRAAGFQFLAILPESAKQITTYGVNKYRTYLLKIKISTTNQARISTDNMDRRMVHATD